ARLLLEGARGRAADAALPARPGGPRLRGTAAGAQELRRRGLAPGERDAALLDATRPRTRVEAPSAASHPERKPPRARTELRADGAPARPERTPVPRTAARGARR